MLKKMFHTPLLYGVRTQCTHICEKLQHFSESGSSQKSMLLLWFYPAQEAPLMILIVPQMHEMIQAASSLSLL